jgi:hypothetical protein
MAPPAEDPPELGQVADAPDVAPRRRRSMETRRRNSGVLREV